MKKPLENNIIDLLIKHKRFSNKKSVVNAYRDGYIDIFDNKEELFAWIYINGANNIEELMFNLHGIFNTPIKHSEVGKTVIESVLDEENDRVLLDDDSETYIFISL